MLARTAALLQVAVLAGAVARDRPQWGELYTRNQVSDEVGLPGSFDPESGENIKWRVKLGTDTYATPVVSSGRILVGTNNGQPRDPRHQGDRGVVMCFREADGAFLWQLVVPKRSEDRYSDWPGVGICSPPTLEGDRAYLVSNRGEVLCLDANGMANGNDGPYRDEGAHMAPAGEPILEPGETDADIVWCYDMVAGVGVRPHDAPHCSVLLHGRFVYACTSNGVDGTHKRIPAPEAPSLVVLDKETGRLVARDGEEIGRRLAHSMWSSPSLGEVNGKPLVFFGAGDAICYAFEALVSLPPAPEVARLAQVWRFDCDPLGPRGDLERYQDNLEIGPSVITGMPVFHDGRIYVTAGGDVWHGKLEAWLKCIDASKRGDITKAGQVWSYPLKRHCMSTPAVREGLAYITDCGRQIHCVDVRSGERRWVHETKGDIWASPFVADGKVYVGTRSRDFWILAASREKKVLSMARMDGAVHATPVAANGVLYVATMTHLYAVARPAPAAGEGSAPSSR